MIDAADVAVVIAMGVATFLCRTIGYVVMAYVPPSERVRRGLEALPGAVVAAVVVPGAIGAGVSGTIGIAIAIAAMAVTRRDLVALVAGCGAAAALRAAGIY